MVHTICNIFISNKTSSSKKLSFRSFLYIILFLPWILGSLLNTAGAATGRVNGKYSVNENGSAGYSIPIKVAPGINGLQPKLALVYNSNAGNGLLGVGWNLSGLSSIVRCSANKIDDGYVSGVNYDSGDRFCLDGQKLVVDTGNYGEANSTYRTYKESWKSITAFGNVGTGLGYFVVKTKEGMTLQYGATTDSMIEPQGRNDIVRIWALSSVSDTYGNSINFSYNETSNTGEYSIDEIRYGNNTVLGTQSTSRVKFTYVV